MGYCLHLSEDLLIPFLVGDRSVTRIDLLRLCGSLTNKCCHFVDNDYDFTGHVQFRNSGESMPFVCA